MRCAQDISVEGGDLGFYGLVLTLDLGDPLSELVLFFPPRLAPLVDHEELSVGAALDQKFEGLYATLVERT